MSVPVSPVNARVRKAPGSPPSPRVCSAPLAAEESVSFFPFPTRVVPTDISDSTILLPVGVYGVYRLCLYSSIYTPYTPPATSLRLQGEGTGTGGLESVFFLGPPRRSRLSSQVKCACSQLCARAHDEGVLSTWRSLPADPESGPRLAGAARPNRGAGSARPPTTSARRARRWAPLRRGGG